MNTILKKTKGRTPSEISQLPIVFEHILRFHFMNAPKGSFGITKIIMNM